MTNKKANGGGLLGSSRWRDHCDQRALGEGPGREFSFHAPGRVWRASHRRGKLGRNHSSGGEPAAEVRSAGHGVVAVCFRQRSARAVLRPHNYSRDLVAYTGGHDNDTTVGWWTSAGAGDSTRTPEDVRKEHDFARAYLGFQNDADAEINWILIRAVLASVADVAIIPLQDVLGLGAEARMNLPGRVSGNWKWRYRPGALTGELSARLRSLTKLYDR